jgi:hypothetical protein
LYPKTARNGEKTAKNSGFSSPNSKSSAEKAAKTAILIANPRSEEFKSRRILIKKYLFLLVKIGKNRQKKKKKDGRF